MKNTVLFLLLITLSLTACAKQQVTEPMNLTISAEYPSPQQDLSAVLFTGHTTGKGDWLGSGTRCYLGFKNSQLSWVINRELTEKRGTYEGGITAVRWLNSRQVLIERRLDDRQQNLVFDTVTEL